MLRLQEGAALSEYKGVPRMAIRFDGTQAAYLFTDGQLFVYPKRPQPETGMLGQIVCRDCPVDEWQQRAHDALTERGWESPWEVCELRLRDGFVEKKSESPGLLIFKRGRESAYQHYVFLDRESGDVVSFKDGGPLRRVFQTIEEAHAWFIKQGSESPWEWVPVKPTADREQAELDRATREIFPEFFATGPNMPPAATYPADGYPVGVIGSDGRTVIDSWPLGMNLEGVAPRAIAKGEVFTMRIEPGSTAELERKIERLEREKAAVVEQARRWKSVAQKALSKIDKARTILS